MFTKNAEGPMEAGLFGAVFGYQRGVKSRLSGQCDEELVTSIASVLTIVEVGDGPASYSTVRSVNEQIQCELHLSGSDGVEVRRRR